MLAQSLDGASTNAAGSAPDGAHLNNANMLVLPDGFPGLMQMYLFGPANRYDGAMDASVVYHEYAHGLSERLVTDAQGYGALDGAQAGAVSEGTSDFYAMDYLVGSQVVADTRHAGRGAGRALAADRPEPQGRRGRAHRGARLHDGDRRRRRLPGGGTRARPRGRAPTTTATSAACSARRRSTPTARSGPRRCGTSGAS